MQDRLLWQDMASLSATTLLDFPLDHNLNLEHPPFLIGLCTKVSHRSQSFGLIAITSLGSLHGMSLPPFC